MFVLKSEITIGSHTFSGVNDVLIKESAKDYLNTCVIKLPASAVLKWKDGSKFESVGKNMTFNVGDKVTVKLGYNGNLKQEFVGFVTQPNFTSPAEIQCEGYSWQLRKRKNIKQSWPETTLDKVLKVVVEGTDIKLHADIPKIPMLNLVVNDASGTQVIDYIKDLFKGVIVFRLIDNVLWAGLAYQDIKQQTVKYEEGMNVISADDLKYKQAKDVNVKVQFKFKGGEQDKEGKSPEGVGAGIVRKEVVSVTDDPSWLKKLAEAKQKQETFNGFEGSITAFLQPYCRAGDRIEYKSKVYAEKNGTYFCAGVEVSFGQSGARRKVELDIKLT